MTLTEINKNFYEKDGQLYWKFGNGNNIVKDSLAGCFNKEYYVVKYKKRGYRLHRLLYQIYNNLEEIPEGFLVDHKDRDTTNNSKENLRLCTKSENNCNRSLNNNNILGIKNIYIKNNKGYSYYYVKVAKNKKTISKLFPLTELENAINWRDQMLQELHGEFSSKG